jgi:hypothetical protein
MTVSSKEIRCFCSGMRVVYPCYCLLSLWLIGRPAYLFKKPNSSSNSFYVWLPLLSRTVYELSRPHIFSQTLSCLLRGRVRLLTYTNVGCDFPVRLNPSSTCIGVMIGSTVMYLRVWSAMPWLNRPRTMRFLFMCDVPVMGAKR